MDIKNFIIEKFSLWGLNYSEALISAEISKLGLQETELYNEENSPKIDILLYNIIPDIMMLPSNISEGGYSVSYDKNSVMKFYNLICKRLGKSNVLEDNKNAITDISDQW